MDSNRMFHLYQVVLLLICHFNVGMSTDVVEIKAKTKENILSTNYPGQYPAGEDKEWRLSHNYGRWLITINDFYLERSIGCLKDYMEISDGQSRPQRWCGRMIRKEMLSSTPNVKIHFHSDFSIQQKGFNITIKRLIDDVEMDRKLKHEQAAQANVVTVTTQPSWVFTALLASLGCALLVFTVLITFLCLEMRKKRLERRSKLIYNGNGFQWPPRKRSDSKSYGRQNSNSSTAPLTLDARQAY